MKTQEIECRFLEIDKPALIKKLKALKAKDQGEVMLEETICYDKDLKWRDEQRFIRLRKSGDNVKVSYKQFQTKAKESSYEIEFAVDNFEVAKLFFEKIGLNVYRHQQKKRHTFLLNDVTIDIDTWPRIPAYVEIEGDSKQALRKAAKALGFDWKKVRFENAAYIIENVYKIPVRNLRWYTFDKFE